MLLVMFPNDEVWGELSDECEAADDDCTEDEDEDIVDEKETELLNWMFRSSAHFR